MRIRLVPAAFAISILIALPACNKHKESSDSQEKSAAVPNAPAPAPPNVPVADNNVAQPPAPAPAPPQPVIVPAGTTLTVKLADELGSKVSQPGQSFSATLDKDVVVDGQTEIPAGASVAGSVVNARPFGHLVGEATLVLKLTSVNINNTDQAIVTASRSFGARIKAKGAVRKFLGGLAKRAEGDEKEVVLAAQSAYTFTLKQPLQIQ